jgi:hypothetical protein
MLRCHLSLLLLLALTSLLLAAEEPISPAKAREFDGQEVTVKMTVKSGRNLLAEKQKVAYLNSEADFKQRENLAVAIHESAAEEMKKSIPDPVVYFQGKTIKVTGKIKITMDMVRLHVEKASQIEVIQEKK